MRVGPLLLPLLVIQLAAANDLYAALGVSRNADSRAIKKAYRKMALQNHPDKQASLSDEQKKAATADFGRREQRVRGAFRPREAKTLRQAR